jgi:hypothetical protein
MKLYAVEITYKAYVLAEDEFSAELFASEIADTESYPDVSAFEVTPPSNPLGWDLGCCVYHETEHGDIHLKDIPQYLTANEQ